MSPIIDKLTKQKEKTQKEVNKLNGMLSNERFVANAPESVVIENKKALEDARTKLEKIQNELNLIS
jgi:valyl-tRNA synthetase